VTVKTTGLNKTQKAKIRESLRKRVRSKFYKKGHVAQTKGKKVSDVKVKKGTQKNLGEQLKKGEISQKTHDTRVAKRAYRKKHHDAMKKRGTLKKMSRASAKTGRKVAAAKKKGKTPVHTVSKSLKGKFTSKAHVTKWGSAKKKQLNALKRAGKLSAAQHKEKMGKVNNRIAHGKKKKYKKTS
jgi:hypothetical protein